MLCMQMNLSSRAQRAAAPAHAGAHVPMLLLLLTMLALVEATRGPVLGMESLPALKEAGTTPTQQGALPAVNLAGLSPAAPPAGRASSTGRNHARVGATLVNGTYTIPSINSSANWFDPVFLSNPFGSGSSFLPPNDYGNINSNVDVAVGDIIEFGWQQIFEDARLILVSVNITKVASGYDISWTIDVDSVGTVFPAKIALTSDAFSDCTSINRTSSTNLPGVTESLSGSTINLAVPEITVAPGGQATWSINCLPECTPSPSTELGCCVDGHIVPDGTSCTKTVKYLKKSKKPRYPDEGYAADDGPEGKVAQPQGYTHNGHYGPHRDSWGEPWWSVMCEGTCQQGACTLSREELYKCQA